MQVEELIEEEVQIKMKYRRRKEYESILIQDRVYLKRYVDTNLEYYYVTENNKFVEKGIKSSATRARKALSEIAKLAKARRAEITDEKDAMDKE